MAIAIVRPCGCDCATVTGPCGCNGVACALECRSKSGIAELCGFEEFVAGAVPPRKWRRRVVSGTMYRGEWPGADCAGSGGENASGTANGTEAGLQGHWQFSWAESTPGMGVTTVTLRRTGGFDPGWNGGSYIWAIEWALAASGSPTGPFNIFDSGTLGYGPPEVQDTRSYGGSPEGLYVRLTWNGRHGGLGGAQALTPGEIIWQVSPSVLQKRDVWDAITQLSAADCTGGTVENHKRFAGTGAFPMTSGGTEEAWSGFSYAPDHVNAYGALVTKTTEATRLTYNGTEVCTGSDPAVKVQGQIADDLTDEDTEAAAMSRADPADWSAPGLCSDATAFITERGAGQFIFGYRKAQVRAQLTGLTGGQIYTVKIRLYRRTVGSGGLFLFFGLLQFNHTATAAAEATAWVDLPNEAGWETKASSCSAVLA